jgi:hypothetical protein
MQQNCSLFERARGVWQESIDVDHAAVGLQVGVLPLLGDWLFQFYFRSKMSRGCLGRNVSHMGS